MKNFVEPTALGQHQEKGFPEIGSTRIAISQLELIGQPTGVSGYAVSRLDPSGSHQTAGATHYLFDTSWRVRLSRRTGKACAARADVPGLLGAAAGRVQGTSV